jgi:hypothetical protein
MTVKNVKMITITIPKSTFGKLEKAVAKTKRSRFISGLIEKELEKRDVLTLKDVHEFWDNLAMKCPRKTSKTAVELLREDRLSH